MTERASGSWWVCCVASGTSVYRVVGVLLHSGVRRYAVLCGGGACYILGVRGCSGL
jgi:hypothetical protein